MKKIVLLIVFVMNFVFVQNMAISQDMDIYQIAYMNRLQNKVKSNWIIPHGEDGINTTILFTIDKNGSILNAKISAPSGDEKFDQSALMSIYKSVPFEHFAQNSQEDTMNVQFFFSQDLISATNVNDNNLKTCENKAVINPTIPDNISLTKATDRGQKVNGIDYSSYMKNLQREIKLNWIPPKSIETRKVVTRFKVDKGGNLSDLRILSSSGDAKVDDAALAAIAKSIPFEPLPTGEKAPSSVEIEFKFDYNVFGNGSRDLVRNVNYRSYNWQSCPIYERQLNVIITSSLPKNYYSLCRKELLLNIGIDKFGKLVAVTVCKSSGDKRFDNKMISAIKKCSFPPIPSSMGVDYFTMNYRINTEKRYLAEQKTSDKWFYLFLGTLLGSAIRP